MDRLECFLTVSYTHLDVYKRQFFDYAIEFYEPNGYKCYYFGGGDDGAMRTGKTTINYDGENTSFYFEKSGGKKGAGVTGCLLYTS